jgi:uncharacterized membrane protein YgcG
MTAEEDTRRRPVIFQTHAEQAAANRRRPTRVLAGATLLLVALAGAAGVALGGSAVWSGVGPNLPNNNPAPLWPQPITPTNAPALAGNSTPSTHDDPATHDNPAAPATTADSQKGKGTSGGSGATSGKGGKSGRGGSSSDG